MPLAERQFTRWWRTRPDPFAAVWPEIRTALECDPSQEATSIFQDIQHRFPARFSSGQLRTLQPKQQLQGSALATRLESANHRNNPIRRDVFSFRDNMLSAGENIPRIPAL